MSWMAALLVSLPIRSQLQKHLIIYLGLIPLFMGLQPQHPLSSIVNWLFGPVLGLLLFPASLLDFLFSPLSTLVDPLWQITITTAHTLANYFTSPQVSFFIPLPALWFYIFLSHFFIYQFLVTKRRNQK